MGIEHKAVAIVHDRMGTIARFKSHNQMMEHMVAMLTHSTTGVVDVIRYDNDKNDPEFELYRLGDGGEPVIVNSNKHSKIQ